MIRLNSTCEVARSFSVKSEKAPDDTEVVVAHLRIAEVMIGRDELDELCGQPFGWSTDALFDEFGAPLAHLTLTLHRSEWSASGVIRGGDKSTDPRLTLKDAELSSVTLELAPLGALLACQLSWVAAGDEVDDIADMLGKLCGVDLVLTDGGQQDMLRSGRPLTPGEIMAHNTKFITEHLRDDRPDPPPRSHRISSADKVMKMLQKDGYHLRGAEPDYWLEHPGRPQDKHGIWLNAAKSVLKRGLEPIGDDQAGDEVGRWRWKEKAA